MFKPLKLRGKLLLSFFLIVMISTVTTTIYSIYFFSEKIKAEALENMRRDIRIAGTLYHSKISEIKDISHFIARDGNLQSLVYFVIEEKLVEYLKRVILREKVHQVVVIESDGKIIGESIDFNIFPDEIEVNFAENELLKKVLKEEKTVAGTERINTSKGEMLAIAAASPIFKKTLGKEIVAIILVRYILNEDVQLIETIQQLVGTTAAIYQCSKAISFKQHFAEPRITPAIYHQLITMTSAYEEIDMRQEGQLAEYQTLYNINRQAVGVLGIHVSANKYVNTIYQAVARLLIIMSICIILSFMLAYLLARSILVPIHQLLNGVIQVTSGDLSHKISINSQDELGILAHSFNSMATQLNEFFQVFKNTIDTLTRTGTALSSEKNLNDLLELLVTESCNICNADEGVLYILEDHHLHFKIIQNKSLGIDQIGKLKPIQFAPILLDETKQLPCIQAVLTKRIIHLNEVKSQHQFDISMVREHDRLLGYKTVKMLVVPLLDRMGDTVGLLKLANPLDHKNLNMTEFTKNQIEIVNSLASQAAVAIENAHTHEKIARKNRAFEKFVPVQFLRHLGKKEVEEINLGDASQENMSVLFSDIRAFTTLSETMTPEENFYFLNDYLKLIGPCITRYEGFIDKFIGDGIMALFSGSCVSVADDALSAALCMLEKLKEFNDYRQHLKKPAITIGIGIHTGPLTLGTIGFASRVETTVIGDTVNLASRIESLTKHYGITIGVTSTTLQKLKVKNTLLIREIDTVQVKGKEEAITVYDVFNADAKLIREAKLKTLERYGEALASYKQGRWDDAICLFHELESQLPNDRVISIYLQRCYVFKANPPGTEWSGITRLDEK